MKCDEPLFKDGDDDSFNFCTRDLGHPGAHEDSFRCRYPRPVPSGDAEEILDAIERAVPQHQRWDLDERDYYIKFAVTNVYLVKVSAESEDAALRQYEDYCDFPDFSREHAIDGGVEISRPERWDLDNLKGAPFGPRVACPDCGALAMRREWMHNPYRRCHGPIKWRESKAPSLRYRYSREFKSAPVYEAVTS
ncbi:MAG TPA: hypothetical protein VIP28_12525 [Nocardioides sp.]